MSMDVLISASGITAAQDELGTILQTEHAKEMEQTWSDLCLDKFGLLESPSRWQPEFTVRKKEGLISQISVCLASQKKVL